MSPAVQQSQLIGFAVLVALAVTLSACKSTTPRAAKTKNPGPFLQAYVVHGIVRELKPEENSIVIQHEDIPGYMPAMTMPFAVKNPKELAGLHPGDQVSFRMIVTAKEGWLEEIQITKPAPPLAATAAPTANALPSNAPVRIVNDVAPFDLGDPLPDYTFTNELGRTVHLGQFKGQALAITFIFTRCPFPTFCPLMSANFAEVQENLKTQSGGPNNWHLLTLSFDPAYDTPAVLKQYAARYEADPLRWNFLTGSPREITALTEQTGLQFWREKPEDPINHNLRTLVVDARGRVQKIFANNNWTSAELVAEMLKAAAAK